MVRRGCKQSEGAGEDEGRDGEGEDGEGGCEIVALTGESRQTFGKD